ncbi:hypothetical protein SADUNF_Sadunf09G0071000 [Salix dunnii]|uniref:Uncharacterized protein n=1 Tax=Salix dunnii TaxID=1413687 RepID=A0A835MW94_9ROSI|nr:hypothetical protein SADUNF_Sadunf09G0071000 [Salix dunnii]
MWISIFRPLPHLLPTLEEAQKEVCQQNPARILTMLPSMSIFIQYHRYAALAMSVPWLHSLPSNWSVPSVINPEVQLSATVGTPNLAFGMCTASDTNAREFLQFETGISMTNWNCEASNVLVTALIIDYANPLQFNKADFLMASYVHHFDHVRKADAAAATICQMFSTKENALANIPAIGFGLSSVLKVSSFFSCVVHSDSSSPSLDAERLFTALTKSTV